MKLMDQYEGMTASRSKMVVDLTKMPSQTPLMINLDHEDMIHSLIESFVVILWRNTADSRVVASVNFDTPMLVYDFREKGFGLSEMHRHDYIEMGYVAKGEFSQLIGGEKHTFTQGSVCVIDRNSEHADYIDDRDGFVVFLCMKEDFFDELFLSEIDSSKVQQFIRKALLKQKNLRQFLQFTPRSGQDTIFPLIEQIAAEKAANRKGAHHIIKGLMIRVFDLLTSDFEINLTETQLKKMDDLLFIEIEEYIGSHYKDVTLKELVDRFHFQEDYFTRLIKKHTGSTFSHFLRGVRIAKAEELLLNTRMSVSSIIEAVGYQNRHYFYSIFLESHKMTPEQFRQNRKIDIKI